MQLKKEEEDKAPPPPPLPVFWIETSESVSRHFEFAPSGLLSVSSKYYFTPKIIPKLIIV